MTSYRQLARDLERTARGFLDATAKEWGTPERAALQKVVDRCPTFRQQETFSVMRKPRAGEGEELDDLARELARTNYLGGQLAALERVAGWLGIAEGELPDDLEDCEILLETRLRECHKRQAKPAPKRAKPKAKPQRRAASG